MKPQTLRVVIVDDSALFRMMLRDTLREIPGVSVIGHAANGIIALGQIKDLDPDAITLDVEMPGMDGLQVLREMRARGDRAQAIMVSRHTAAGAQTTTDALLEGALDFIHKPSGPVVAENRGELRSALAEKLAVIRTAVFGRDHVPRSSETQDNPDDEACDRPCELVLIGSSTGGPDALRQLLPSLPTNFPAPVLVVQHMPPVYTASLASRLNELCPLEVSEAKEGSLIQPGRVLVAPGGRHMGIAKTERGLVTRLSDDPPEHNCRPAVDYLFRSAFESVPNQKMLGVILTGMGTDGTEGCALLKDCGGRILAQHASDCAVYGMPKSVIEQGLADRVLSLRRLPIAIRREVS